MWLLREITLPHLTHHGWRTALTALGIAVGVAAIVATASVTDAVFRSFRRTVEATGGRAELVVTNGNGGVPETLVDEIRALPDVATAEPLVEGFVQFAEAEENMLAIFGLDLLGNDERLAQLPRDALEVPDETAFLNQPDSIMLPRSFAQRRGYRLGAAIEVLAPDGPRRLVVRGLVDAQGPAALYGGIVGLMDLPAAQRLLAKEERVDRIDVRLANADAKERVLDDVTRILRDRGRVEETSVHGAKAADLLFSLRVAVGIAGLVAAVVGFFIIYHTVTVSIVQRRREIALLNALGVSRAQILMWLLMEAAALALAAATVGLLIGHLLARLAVSTFGTVTAAWIRLPPEAATLQGDTIVLAMFAGLLTTLAATVIPACAIIWRPPARFLHLIPQQPPINRRVWQMAALGTAGLVLVVVLLQVFPQTASYTPTVAFIFFVNCLTLVSFALLSPAPLLAVGLLMHHIADRGRGLVMLLAGRSLARNSVGAVAVVAGIVMGFGWILANSSLVLSLKDGWLYWLEHHYQSDLLVTAGGTNMSLLTYPPVSGEVVDELRRIDGVSEAQGIRTLEIAYAGRPAVLQAIDPSSHGLPVVDGEWRDIADAFWKGDGTVVTENFAYKHRVKKGDAITLATPRGERQLSVLGVFADFQGAGDLGGIAISRPMYRQIWNDSVVSRIRVWTKPGINSLAIQDEVHRRLGGRYGLHALTFAEARASAVTLVNNAFSMTYAVIFISLIVSFVGVTNFLLTTVLDRTAEFTTLNAVGVPHLQIGGAIVMEGVLLGIVGVAVGLIAGDVISRIIIGHSVPMVNGWRFQYEFPGSTAVALSIGSVALAAVAGLLPARLAVRRDTLPPERPA